MAVNTTEIVKKAKNCLKKGEQRLSAQIALGIAAFEDGQVSEAVGNYRKALQMNPDSPEANAGMGISYARLGDLAQAECFLRKALELNPGCGMLANWLADVYFDLGKLDQAVEYYTRAIRLDAMDSNAHNDMADVYRIKGDFKRALELYERAIQIDPLDTNAMLERAQCLIQLDQVAEALQALDQLIDGFPSSRDCATAMVVKGTLKAKDGNDAEALDIFKQALEFFPFNRTVIFQAAVCAARVNKIGEAEAFLRRILEMTPDDRKALALLRQVKGS